MKQYSKIFYLVGFLCMPLFILLLVYGYVKLNQMTSEEIYWGHNRSFAFAQASREGKTILLSVTKHRCDALRGLECGEGKLDLAGYVLLNINPSHSEFQNLISDDRFAELKSGELPRYYILNTNGEIRFSSKELPSLEDIRKLRKE
ncbi:hypothetical protein LPTSP3_g37600 [Leptospira kobayashii]|uniref:Lipoprotein n=1 Tax=Leptospira kobayashii TaxID=1917830 RepID=A0ABN6KJ23_9LEPT|nr:hypothetical protein [Leptospira kobayashii]BDA80830.1 hypothetical protein LPTSP3_g37600 [Leptospira kobayashii]